MHKASDLAFLALSSALAFAVAFSLLLAIATAAKAEAIAMGPVVESAAGRSSSAPAPEFDHDQAVVDVDRGIRYTLQDSPCWGLAMDDKGRHEMARMIAAAARSHDVPPLLLTVMVKRESSFSSGAVGASHGEIGLLQVHGLAARGCELETPEGQLACGARWLRKAHDKCGTWQGAITAYAAGRCNARKGSRLEWVVLSRYRYWKKARRAVDSCNVGDAEHWVCQPRKETCIAAVRSIARTRSGERGEGARLPRVQNP